MISIDDGAPTTTVIVSAPVFPSVAAVMVTVPGVTPVTSPLFETRATASSLDDQLKA